MLTDATGKKTYIAFKMIVITKFKMLLKSDGSGINSQTRLSVRKNHKNVASS